MTGVQTCALPISDTNGDGLVDDTDLPVIVVSDLWGVLSAYIGDGSGVAFSVAGALGVSAPAIADMNGDSEPELVTAMADGSVAAYDGAGNLEWTSPVLAAATSFPTISVADLDGDGDVEIVTPSAALSGADGSLVFSLPVEPDVQIQPTVVDLDLDGRSEILLGRTWYDADGHLLISEPRGGYSEFNAVVDVEGDGLGEVVTVSTSRLTLQDATGATLVDVALPGTREPGVPAVADFDGDGAPEICVPDETALGIYEIDGSLLWSASMDDYSGWAGCFGFDVDADGATDAVLADETGLRIYDGRTGTVMFTDNTHRSGTVFEYPVVADVDGDDVAELVVVDNMGGYNGLTVYSQADGVWPDADETWAVFDLPLTAVEPDGTVPSRPASPWNTLDTFHARPGNLADVPQADLRVAIDDVCVADCDFGPVLVGLHVENIGLVDVPAGAVVSLYTAEGTLLTQVTLGDVPAGRSLAGVTIELTPADVTAGGFVAIVDEAGTVQECDEADNTATWGETGCG